MWHDVIRIGIYSARKSAIKQNGRVARSSLSTEKNERKRKREREREGGRAREKERSKRKRGGHLGAGCQGPRYESVREVRGTLIRSIIIE